MDKVKPEFVISARDSAEAAQFPSYVYEEHERAREALEGFVNPALIQEDQFATLDAIQAVTTSRVNWTGKKLPILQQLAQEHPERTFVYVDDAMSAAVINPAVPNVIGVPLSHDAAFWSLR